MVSLLTRFFVMLNHVNVGRAKYQGLDDKKTINGSNEDCGITQRYRHRRQPIQYAVNPSLRLVVVAALNNNAFFIRNAVYQAMNEADNSTGPC
jgi:hypothetical protein